MLNIINLTMEHTKEPRVMRTWLNGGCSKGKYPRHSITLTIPVEFQKYYNLDKPTQVLVTPTKEGLLIKKLELQKND